MIGHAFISRICRKNSFFEIAGVICESTRPYTTGLGDTGIATWQTDLCREIMTELIT